MKKIIDIVSTGRFEVSLAYYPTCASFGIKIGNNARRIGKPCNVFIEIDFLFWTLGGEYVW